MRYLYALLFLAVASFANAQISFTNQTTLLTDPASVHSGVAMGVTDMNGDGLDDIVRLNNTNNLSIEYQALPNQNFTHFLHGAVQGNAWAMVLGDLNNDGSNDIFVGGSYDGAKLLTNNGGSFSTVVLPNSAGQATGLFVQGSNFADINNDGWLDVFACHDDGAPRIWGNNGTGSFANNNDWINMATVPVSDNSGNYGSVWTDFDNDRDLDLYIAKCRQGENDPTNPRRINALFVNDGQNNFTEKAGEAGLKIGWQSWTADFQDIDNDGDMDCLVTNHDYPLMLLENDGQGHFSDIATAAGVAASGYFIQGVMRDFDNDGFVDIITTGNFNTAVVATHLFHNNGDKTFTEIINPFGGNSIGSLAIGDLNNDGFLDFYAAYPTSFNNPGSIADRLWMNSTNNGNNHLAINLQGTVSNRMGVGARVEIHGDWGIQIREVRSGESYGIQNSLTQHFGLGSSTSVEYVVVHWPSGMMDVVKNPAINGALTIVEGSTCTMPDFAIGTSGSTVLCAGESITLAAPAGYDYLWSNGMVGQNITVSEQGNYSVVIVDAQGCAAASEVLAILVSPDETPTLTLAGEDSFCEGGSAVITASTANGYTWSNGETTQSITVTQTGEYSVVVQGACGNFTSQTIHVEVLPASLPAADDVTIPAPGTATLEATGDNLLWYDSPSATVPLFSGPSFTTPFLTADDTFYVEDAHAYNGGSFETGMLAPQGNSLYNGNNTNGATLFEVFHPIKLKQVTVKTDLAGQRMIKLIKDPFYTPVDSVIVDVPVGEAILDIDFEINEPGNYRLATDSLFNTSSIGMISPRLQRSSQNVSYPYTVPEVMSIITSDLGSGLYYYFFDWKIEAIPDYCVSDRVPVKVTVLTSGAAEQFTFGNVSVQPNPSNGLFTLKLEGTQRGAVNLQVADLAGRVVFRDKFEASANIAQQQNLDLTGLPAGLYFLKIANGEKSGVVKIVVE